MTPFKHLLKTLDETFLPRPKQVYAAKGHGFVDPSTTLDIRVDDGRVEHAAIAWRDGLSAMGDTTSVTAGAAGHQACSATGFEGVFRTWCLSEAPTSRDTVSDSLCWIRFSFAGFREGSGPKPVQSSP